MFEKLDTTNPAGKEATFIANVQNAGGLKGRTDKFDAKPGDNVVYIRNLPEGTTFISVWVSEADAKGNSKVGDAYFHTQSVQLFNNGTECRVKFNSSWKTALPAIASVIYG